MDVGYSLEAVFRLDCFEYLHPFFEADTSITVDRGAVGLIERALEEDIELGVLFLERGEGISHRAAGVEAFQRTGTSEE